MTEQDSRPEPAPGQEPDAADGRPAPADGPEAIPAHTDDPRDVDPVPADAARPDPRPDPGGPRDPAEAPAGEPAGSPAHESAQAQDQQGADTEPTPATDPATVPDYEQLAAEDPRTPGQLLAAVHGAEASRDEYLESLQRKQAEFENFRKRMQANGQAQRVAGHADVAERMLEVLDDFDRTIASVADEVDDQVLKGVTLVRDKLMGALREVGLERVDDQGSPFDPNRHEAVQQVPADGIVVAGGEPVVAEVLRPGYVLGPRVLRAAMVAVAQ